MIDAGKLRGLPMTGAARKVTRNDLDQFDLILAMDDGNYSILTQLSTSTNLHKVKRFHEFYTRHTITEVPDPYYGSTKDFELVLDLLEDGCAEIVRRIPQGAIT